MSDWVVDTDTPTSSPSASAASPASDWVVDDTPVSRQPQANESEDMALLKAPYRVGEDLYRGAANAVTSIPGYWNAAQTEIPGAYNDITQHPGHAFSQFAGGLAQLGHGLLNTPHNIADYEANRLNLIPQAVANNIPSQGDINPEINSYFGAPNQAGDQLLQGAGRHALDILGGAQLATTFNPLKLLASQKGIKNALLSSHDALENDASQAFKTVSDQVNGRRINQIPTNNNPNLSPQFFKNMMNYYPNTRASTDLLNQASSGDYNALRKLQTDLYTRAKKNLGSDLEADRMKGEEMMESRNDINQAISNHLKNTGNNDLDDLLTGARNDWSTLQNTYYNQDLPSSLIKMFDKNVRKIPDNLTSILSENSIPMNNLKDFHPGITQKVNAINTRNKLAKYVAGAGGLGVGGTWLYNQMFGGQPTH